MVDQVVLDRALHPDLRIGRGILCSVAGSRPGTLALFTQPEPSRLIDPALRQRALTTVFVQSLAEASLESVVGSLPTVDYILAVGGGVTMDAAKYAAWKTGTPLILAPSIISVDAAVTNTVAVRRAGKVIYQGFVAADVIVADLDLISAAPARLNRAGVGDLLSIYTALTDWKLAASSGHIAFDSALALRSEQVLERVWQMADDIARVSDNALAGVVTSYAEINALCLEAGHSGPEEGSEHYFAYRVEDVTQRSYVHGELVGLGCVLMAALQGNDHAKVASFLDRCRVEWRPVQLGLTRGECRLALIGLSAYVRASGLPHSIIDEVDLGEDGVRRLMSLHDLRFADAEG
ncbi:MAG: iron-containing alcohol dehydrogenase [Chloroflexi bacterium]|nr:iron-containing alcohol dehydrogenase [Chloroflexota bacterium]